MIYNWITFKTLRNSEICNYISTAQIPNAFKSFICLAVAQWNFKESKKKYICIAWSSGMGVSWVVAMAIVMYWEGGFVSCFNAVMPRRPDDWKWMKFYMRLRTNEWMNGWLVGWMNEWMCEWMPHGMCQYRRGSPRKLALGGGPICCPFSTAEEAWLE